MAQVDEGDLQSLVQTEDVWSDCWFVPGEVLVQGCDKRGELCAD